MNIIQQIYPAVADGLNDILSPLLIYTFSVVPKINYQKWAIVGQLVVSIVLLSLYASNYINGVTIFQITNSTLIYTFINIGKIALFCYLLKNIYLQEHSEETENNDQPKYNIQST